MLMQGIAVKSAEVRSNFKGFIDSVINQAPQVVNRHGDHFIAMSLSHLQPLVNDIALHATIEEDDDGSFLASSDEVSDVFVSAASPEEAIHLLAYDLVEYAKEYLGESFNMYFRAPNRRHHFPVVLKIMLFDSVEEVAAALDANATRS